MAAQKSVGRAPPPRLPDYMNLGCCGSRGAAQ